MAQPSGEKLSFIDKVNKRVKAHMDGADPEMFDQIRVENGPRVSEMLDAAKKGREDFFALCKQHNLTEALRVRSHSLESLRNKACNFTKSIFKNRKFLQNVLDRHEATIHRRWLKKTKNQRRTVILEAWGAKMALSHRPDFDALEDEDDVKRFKGTAYRDAYLWPYINEEDLCNYRSLLLLMSTRARCHPSDLAASEHDAHRVGRSALVFKAFVSVGWEDYRIDLTSRTSDEAYGRLWKRSTNPEYFDTLTSRRYHELSDGLEVLEAQERVLSFLVKCAMLILHDFTEDALLQSPVQPFTDLSSSETGYASLAIIAAESPYQPPGSLDFARIASLLAAKHDRTADHLWSLREDPGYFETQMMEYKEHRRELLVDPRGRQHPLCSDGMEDLFWARVLADQLFNDYFQLEVFANLRLQAKRLRVMQKLYANEINTSSNVPEPYQDAINKFRICLLGATGLATTELVLGFHASPPMRRYHTRTEETDPAAEVTMAVEERQPAEHGRLNNVVDELQRLIDAGPAKSLISAYLASLVVDLAIVCECLHQLDLYMPSLHTHDESALQKLHVEQDRLLELETRWGVMFYTIDENAYDLVVLGKITDGKFTYPIAKRRTKENVEIMRVAERNLDKFWRKVDQDMLSNSEFKSGAVHRLMMQDRQLQRTPEWVEPVHETAQPPIKELYIPFSQPLFDSQEGNRQTQRENSAQPHKEKIKTRRLGGEETPAAEAEVIDVPTEVHDEPHFAISNRALKVFKTLFFTPSESSSPGEVAWTDFLHAMVAVGFVPEKLYGSVWQFSPDSDKVAAERSIQFHEPHGGNSKIPYRIARRHGRRLNRAYGWHGAMFTLKERSEEKSE